MPTMSMARDPAGIAGWRASARMARAKPRTSSAVTPLERSAASNAPASAGGISAPVSARSSSPASASLNDLPDSRCSSVSRRIIAGRPLILRKLPISAGRRA